MYGSRQAGRVPQGELTPGVTEHRPPIQAHRLPEPLQVVDGLRHGERPVWTGRAAAATLVEPHDQVQVVKQPLGDRAVIDVEAKRRLPVNNG